MAALLCSTPWWTNGHVSTCVGITYLSLFIPLVASLASVVLICFWYFRQWKNKVMTHGYQLVPAHEGDNDTGDVNAPHGDLEPWRAQLECTITVSWRPQVLEALFLSVDIIIGTVTSIHSGEGHRTPLLSIYLLVILAIRLLWHSSKLCMALRSHSEALYCVQWLCVALITHAALVAQGPSHDSAIWVGLLRLGLLTGLIMLHWTAPREPSTQQEDAWDATASLLSRLFFSWLDPLLWKAFRAGPLQTADLYPLSHLLVSSTITRGFHATAPSSTSMVRRTYHFLKRDLLRQGMWAALTGVLVFAPPYLIKLILEYLESPADTTTSTAWLYVMGLFVSSAIAGMAESQCGWVGYIISAKLRAVLLDQIYSKILRRRMVGRSPQSSDKSSVAESQYMPDGTIYNFVSGVC